MKEGYNRGTEKKDKEDKHFSYAFEIEVLKGENAAFASVLKPHAHGRVLLTHREPLSQENPCSPNQTKEPNC